MSHAELDNAYQAMQYTWYELVRAGQRGVPPQELERLYALYIGSVEEYNRYTEANHLDRTEQPEASFTSTEDAHALHTPVVKNVPLPKAARKRKAS